jgi:putative DNA modification/repair radical SAM protein
VLIQRAGQVADRLSVNLELPSEQSLSLLAPEKKKQSLLLPMQQIQQGIVQRKQERSLSRKAPAFVPAGQTTQMIVGASGESDLQILRLSAALYQKFSMKRVYFSAYIPLNTDSRLPQITQPPMLRENRLYQADWLMRFYGFSAQELLDERNPNFDPDYDPKVMWAIRHPEQFPVEVNTASYQQLLRVPGLGVRCAQRIVSARKTGRLDFGDLLRMHVSLKRAQYFITCKGKYYRIQNPQSETILRALKPKARSPYEQLTLFDAPAAVPASNVEVLDDHAFFPKANETATAIQQATDLLPAF